MPNLFFFSYARHNSDEYLKKFFDDLSGKIRDQLGLDQEEEVGFFDQPQLELGAQWNSILSQQLQECKVIVSLYSPAYFSSTYCGKEWEWFRRRSELFVTTERAAGNNDVESPPVIKPVIWIPLSEDQSAPEAVGGTQYFMGDPRDDQNKVGLKTMRRRYATYEATYDDFIETLKNQILEAQNIALPRLTGAISIDRIDSAFHPVSQGTPQPQMTRRTAGRKGPSFVRFVFIAGDPDQFPAGARTREFYLQAGGAEWKPYYPDKPRAIEFVAQDVAVELEISNEQLPFDVNLAEAVREAEDDRSLVVLFVDSWSAELEFYKPVLKELDRHAYMNCSIFVPWNENDPQTAVRGEELKQVVRKEIFPRWSRLAESDQPFFFRDSIYSLDDLRDQLRDTLRQLQISVGKEGIERATRENIPRRIDSNIAKPSISHKPPPQGIVP